MAQAYEKCLLARMSGTEPNTFQVSTFLLAPAPVSCAKFPSCVPLFMASTAFPANDPKLIAEILSREEWYGCWHRAQFECADRSGDGFVSKSELVYLHQCGIGEDLKCGPHKVLNWPARFMNRRQMVSVGKRVRALQSAGFTLKHENM